MRMVTHGGYCCGIRTIWGMGISPTAKQSPIPKQADPVKGWLVPMESLGSNKHCFPYEEFPEETGAERLAKLIEMHHETQPAGIIEVTTAADQTDYWREELEKHGFKESCSCLNSNSSNIVTVWHRCQE